MATSYSKPSAYSSSSYSSSKYCSPSSSTSSSSLSSRSLNYRAVSLDRPSASSSTTRPLSRFSTSSYSSSGSSALSSFESRYPSLSTNRYTSRPPRPAETASKFQYESVSARKERLTAATSSLPSRDVTSGSSYLASRESRLYGNNNNNYDSKSCSRESSISRDTTLSDWRANRRERSSSRGNTRLEDSDGPLTHFNQGMCL